MAGFVSQRIGVKDISRNVTVPNNSKAKLMYYLSCVKTVIQLDDSTLQRLTDYHNYHLLNDPENRCSVGNGHIVQSRWAVGKSVFFTMKTAEVEVTNSLSWAQCLTCWLWQTTLWSEERERELPKWCSSRHRGWTTTTSLLWGHSRGGCKGWRVACREEEVIHVLLLLHLRLFSVLRLYIVLPTVVAVAVPFHKNQKDISEGRIVCIAIDKLSLETQM